ncbi:MAG: alpha/beta hydrolase [Caulobacteraceae bacterium]
MQPRIFETAQGQVPLWGAFESFDAARPLMLVVRGAFADLDNMTLLPRFVPFADVVLAHLPGMHGPFLKDHALGTFATALDEVIAAAFAGRRTLALGLSTGALAAFLLRRPEIRSILAVEPPLTTAGLWPLHDSFRRQMVEEPRFRDWIVEVFGITEQGVIARDYRPLVEAVRVPVRVLLGEDPLEPHRAVERLPSLVGEADRRFLQGLPGLRVDQVPGTGHNVPYQNPGYLVAAVRQALLSMTRPGS